MKMVILRPFTAGSKENKVCRREARWGQGIFAVQDAVDRKLTHAKSFFRGVPSIIWTHIDIYCKESMSIKNSLKNPCA